MRVLSFDPGAKRCGYAVLDQGDTPKWVGSGILGVEREEGEDFQPYRLRVIEFWSIETERLLRRFKPNEVVSEVLPAIGFGQASAAAQSFLAHAAISAIQTVAFAQSLPVKLVSASTMKKQIGGSGKATKAKVRDGIYQHLPELRDRHAQWTNADWDETDAVAIALCHLGYQYEN